MTRFYFGIAGIPPEVHQDVERENKAYAEGAGFCLDKMPHGARYGERNVTYFKQRFYQMVANEDQGAPHKSAFAIVYVERDPASTQFFVDSFFPYMLLIPVQWELDLSQGPGGVKASKNRLIPLLAKATARARASLRVLQDELEARASATPFLLPTKNFDSPKLSPTLRELHTDLARTSDAPVTVVERHSKSFKKTHATTRVAERDCFVDDSKIVFRPPGNDRHGYARPGDGHPPECLLAGHRRLGAPYDPKFHYDCSRKGGEGSFTARLHGCHEPMDLRTSRSHINVSPNDNLRIPQK